MKNNLLTKKSRKIRKNMLLLYLMVLPGVAYIFINNYLPLPGLVIAFKRFNYSKGIWQSDWCGFKNFTYLFKTNEALKIAKNTLLYNLAFIFFGNFLAVVIAIMLTYVRSQFSKNVYQTVILIPYLISITVVSFIVYAFLGQQSGYLNTVLQNMGKNGISWYTQAGYWPYILIFVYLWKNFGYTSILYYATAIGIDSTLYEAAMLDGAGRFRQILHVTLPGLKKTIIIMVLLQVGKVFYSDFGLFYQVPMRSGLIASTTDTIDVFVYRSLSQLNDIGRASAAGFLQSVLGFILILIVNAIVKKIDEESALF